jgi:hypothetical protein
MADAPAGEAFRIHVWIRQISPMIWRRLLVDSDSSIADLHLTLQIAFGWSDSHLHRFHIHGRDYGIGKIGGISFSTDANQVRLLDFRFRINERFRYEYDFGDAWQHEVRVERRLPLDGTCVYPRCIGGRRQAPPEDCGGPLAFTAQRDRLPIQVDELFWQVQEDMRAGDLEAIRDRQAEIDSLSDWLALETFDRRAVNRRLKQYAMNDAAWMCQSGSGSAIGGSDEDPHTGGDRRREWSRRDNRRDRLS